MTSTKTMVDFPDRSILLGIAIIPSLDCLCNQLNTAFQLHLGPISFLQALRSVILLSLIFLSARILRRQPELVHRLPFPALGAIAILGMAVSRELLLTGSVTFDNIGSYGQMAYWVVLWITVCLYCHGQDQAEMLLQGLAVGACLTAASVLLGLVFGAGNYYKDDLVHASAGWFDTAKMITGLLVVGGIINLYLGRDRRRWLATIASGLCFVACILTYARAGTVAVCVVVVWLTLWRLLFCRSSNGQWLNLFLGLGLVGCLVVPLVADTHTLFARWSDVGASDKAGSGRSTFWKIAIDAYVAEDVEQQAVGIGHTAMADMLFRDYGDDIRHTHNDMLDLLLVGGFAGVLWLLSLIGSFIWTAFQPSIGSASGAAAIAIVLAYLCHSQLTGQVWGTDAMTYYTVSLTCLARIDRPVRSHALHSVATPRSSLMARLYPRQESL